MKPITDELIRKVLREQLETFCIEEGIRINPYEKSVEMDDTTDDYVDTSVECNPSVTNGMVDGVELWSVFQRNRQGTEMGDGNPLVYAMKGDKKKGWTMDEKNTQMVIDRAREIASKYFASHQVDATVLLPSHSRLNRMLCGIISSVNPDVKIIDGLIWKMSIDEVNDAVLDGESTFRKIFDTREKFTDAYNRLKSYFKIMERDYDGYFTFHAISDGSIRDAITKTLKLSEDVPYVARCSDDINGKNVLIIDDTVRSGASLNDACSIVKSSFTPKSLSILTMFSPLR